MQSPAEIYRIATENFEQNLLKLASDVDAGIITETMYNRSVRDIVFVYENALLELSKYSTDLDELFRLEFKGKTLSKDLRYPLEEFLFKQENLRKFVDEFSLPDAIPESAGGLKKTYKVVGDKATLQLSQILSRGFGARPIQFLCTRI